MNSDNKQAGERFLKTYNDLVHVAKELAPIEREHLSMDGLGSVGIEFSGQSDFYKQKCVERQNAVDEMKRLREQFGDEAVVDALKEIDGSEEALNYIRDVPLREFKREQEPTRERRRWFKFR